MIFSLDFLHCASMPIVFMSAIERPFSINGEMHLLLLMKVAAGSSMSRGEIIISVYHAKR